MEQVHKIWKKGAAIEERIKVLEYLRLYILIVVICSYWEWENYKVLKPCTNNSFYFVEVSASFHRNSPLNVTP